MSEEIDINTISTTQEDFERFQAAAVSVFEDEDEYITLSDIVPPQPLVPDLSEELNSIPYDNEIELSSTNDDGQSNEINFLNSRSNTTRNNDCMPRELEILGEPSQTKHHDQNAKDQVDMSAYDIGGQELDSSETLIQDSYLSTTVDQGSSNDTHDTTQDKINLRRTTRERVPNTSKYVFTNTNTNQRDKPTTNRKRGRPKKSSNENQTEPDSTNTENTTLPNELTNNTSKGTQKKQIKKSPPTKPGKPSNNGKIEQLKPSKIVPKRGRPRKNLNVSNVVETSEQNLPSNGVSEITEPVTSGSMTVQNGKRKSKALPKTIQVEKDESANDNIKANNDNSDDDICLSMLKNYNTNDSCYDELQLIQMEMMNSNEEVLDKTNPEENKTLPLDKNTTKTNENITKEDESKVAVENVSENKENKVTDVAANNVEVKPEENKSLEENSLLVEDTKRPNRRNAKKIFHYDEGSDEDPFANMESSDDDADKFSKKKKGNKYSDEEYVPEFETEIRHTYVPSSVLSSNSDSEVNVELDNAKKKRRRTRKKSDACTPRKKGKKIHENNISSDGNDILNSSVIKLDETSKTSGEDSYKRPAEAWATSNEFENFIVQKIQNTSTKIKKVRSTQNSEKKVIPLDIPVLDPIKDKPVEKFTQTNVLKTNTIALQTTSPYDIPMKKNVTLSDEQSTKACEFLNGIVQTTVELGQLMSQKSEDFMKKKINTANVTNTMKMDYCVKKSFLLFKLAKHNLMQMEEDLAQQYEEFLQSNKLSSCRDIEPVIVPKVPDNDSDCEIVDVKPVAITTLSPTKEKPKFNPKTVFLNKELSIKIAKKPPVTNTTTLNSEVTVKKIESKKRHEVWINDSIMVKKVKSNQSFLAQDSRNKKPPDTFVTQKMVSDFFKEYNRQKAVTICAPYVSNEWLQVRKEYACHYFVKFEDFKMPSSSDTIALELNTENGEVSSNNNHVHNIKNSNNPQSLLVLCMESIHECLKLKTSKTHANLSCNIPDCNGKKEPVTLFRLSMNALTHPQHAATTSISCKRENNRDIRPIGQLPPLKTLCYTKIVELINLNEPSSEPQEQSSIENFDDSFENDIVSKQNLRSINISSKKVNTLLTLSLETIKNMINFASNSNEMKINNYSHLNKAPLSLKDITYKTIKKILFDFEDYHKSVTTPILEVQENQIESFTINCVNTLTDEAFQNLQNPEIEMQPNASDNENDEDDFDGDYDLDNNDWDSQLLEQELQSCFTPTGDVIDNTASNTEADVTEIVSHIKIEPIEDFSENVIDSSIVKTEPLHALDGMTMIPDSIITKKELIDNANPGSPLLDKIGSYDGNLFENFVSCNKMIHSLEEDSEIYSQSALRIRRQHEPDFEEENDMSMSLLVPQTYEPLHIESAKGSLMNSSSDSECCDPKKSNKKKNEKKKKPPKKDTKTNKTKDVPNSMKSKTSNGQVAILTRKMRERIRQEEKKHESSESESETSVVNIKKNKKDNDKKSSTTVQTPVNEEIQCSNVDSTENLVDSKKKSSEKNAENNTFPGFSAIDQNETICYQKYVKFVFDKIVPDVNEKDKSEKPQNENPDPPVICPNDPVELLECEPTLPDMFGLEKNETNNKIDDGNKKRKSKPKINYKERHGWHCYPFDAKDTKLYQNTKIVLEKLPETFVDTYLEYQEITNKDQDDEEVDRLINLNSLNRTTGKEGKSKTKSKVKTSNNEQTSAGNSQTSRSASPLGSDHLEELTPSEDEGANVDDEIPPPVPIRSSENALAKNLLMDDEDSDSEVLSLKKIKKENVDEAEAPTKPGPKSKTKMDRESHSESVMLTADKMMNKELSMLHAPVTLSDETKKTTPVEEPVRELRRSKQKKESKNGSKERIKMEDDSSSEEEKQWVTTKEKLLKRLDKKGNASADDAKNIKLVNEFIEKRNDSEGRKIRTGRRGSRKKFLERQKQLRVLSKELFGESSIDASHMSKRGGQGLFKGRRNIRKVIDKKSLARSTVIANMEEFERKRRLNMRQQQLREITGCEDDVNVLVINDEVCLEYDFDHYCPIVTVHPFFTKVMKAHQYEGVKFMWDACFESLEQIEAGHPGSGCILAHCMGLGKTLQVLALLHTVLTHPRVGMKRVLVCCPLSTVLNWVDEIHKWLGPVTDEIKVFELSKLRKTYERAYQLEDWYNGGGIFIIGYELFRSLTTLDPLIDDIRPTIINKIRKALLDPGPDIIICDEGHLLKNDASVLAVAMSRVVTKRRIVLTGTPMQNNLREYYCMVNFIKPNLLGTYSEYSNRFENPIMNGQHRDSLEEDIKLMKARTHILHKVLEGCLQRQEASVLYPYLPKKHEYTVFIPLTTCQWDLYKHYLGNYANKSKQSVLKDFHTLQKIWSHPQALHKFQTKSHDSSASKIKSEKVEDDLALEDKEDIKPMESEVWWLQYLDGGKMLETLESSNKFVAVFKILHECNKLGDKVLIFSTSLFCLDALEYFLKRINNWNLGKEYYRLDGSVPAEVRQKWCREFNSENNNKTKLFLISTRAGCLGLNMTAANRVIIMDTSWNPAHDIQSIFRVYRFGQKKDCFIYRLVAMGTMEQKIYERSVTKQAVACRVVDEQQIDRHYNMAELNELYKYDETGAQVAGGVAVGVCDVALLRVARDAALHAVHEHDSLLRGGAEPALPEHERAAAWNQFQQEHAHKQIQNEMDARTAALRVEAGEGSRPPAPADVAAYHKKSKPETRGRKPKRPPAGTEPKTEPGEEPPAADPHADQMVRRITEILVEHNFTQTANTSHQIAELVERVRRTVSEGGAAVPADQLTASIARVLLRHNAPPAAPAQEPAPDAPPDPVDSSVAGRKKRKAALAAEVQFDSLSQDSVIDLDDDEWCEGAPSEPPPAEPAAPPPVRKARGLAGPKSKKNRVSSNESILLSDDETPPPILPKPSPSVRKSKAVPVPTRVLPPIPADLPPAVPADPPPAPPASDKVPLHTSLLTNQNFVKIVAHTYLTGNPMLDEDAAVLAAQYSTLKALKEVESTGKEIVDGPIYEIAVKILGMGVLQKLHLSTLNSKDSNVLTDLQSALSETKQTISSPSMTSGPKAKPKTIIVQNYKKITLTPPVQQKKFEEIVPTQISNNSICLDATEAEPEAEKEECILPDTGDTFSSTIPAKKSTSTPMVVTKVVSSEIKVKRIVLVNNQKKTPAAAGAAPAVAAPAGADTICLDSDDDEPVPAAPAGPRAAPPPGAPAPPVLVTAGGRGFHRLAAPGPHPVRLTCVGAGPPPVQPGIPVPDSNIVLVPMLNSDHSMIKLTPTRPDAGGPDVSPAPVRPIAADPERFRPGAGGPVTLSDVFLQKPVPQDAAMKSGGAPAPKTNYRVGDIFRITKTGQIEKLDRTEVSGGDNDVHIIPDDEDSTNKSYNGLFSQTTSKPTLTSQTPNSKFLNTSKPSSDKIVILNSKLMNNEVISDTSGLKQPTSTPKQPTSTPKQPTSTSKQPTSTPKQPTSTSKQPTSTSKQPTSTSKQPTSTSKEPTSIPKQPTSTPNQATSTSKQPTSTTKQSTSTPKQPKTTIYFQKDTEEVDDSATPSTDPLDLFKNVVHIQAPSISVQPTSSKSSVDSTRSKPLENPSVPKMKDITNKKSQENKSMSLLLNTSKELKNSTPAIKEKKDVKRKTNNSKKAQNTIDLTNIVFEPLASTSKSKVSSETISLLGKSSTPPVKKQKSEQETKKTYIVKAPEKRPAPSKTNTVDTKKKKTTLLTLKDFNIDDIDDIIELD